MNIKFILATFTLFLISSSASAERVIVRSADHDGYSRLVVHLAERIDWTLSQAGTKNSLLLNIDELEFDLSQVFTRMSNSRISGVRPISGRNTGLTIELNCTCQVEVFWHGKSMLVLDVKDSQLGDDIDSIPYQIPKKYNIDLEFAKYNRRDANASQSLGNHQKKSLAPIVNALKSYINDKIADSDFPRSDKISERDDSLNQLNRAESLNLIDLDKSKFRPDYDLKDGRPLLYHPLNVKKQIYGNAYSVGNIKYSLSTDQQWGKNSPITSMNTEERTCIPHDILSIVNWGGVEPFTSQLSRVRKQNVENSGGVDRLEYMRVAKLYLYFGFGAEAKQILLSLDTNDKLKDIYIAISDIMDGVDSSSNVFSGQSNCDSNVALWSILSANADTFGKPVNYDAALRALSRLPIHLKRHLAHLVIKKLEEEEQFSASSRIQQTLRSALKVENTPWTYDMSEALPADKLEDHSISIVNYNNENSPLALIKLIDDRLDRAAGIPLEWAVLVGAYAHEKRNTDIEESLNHRYARALVAAGQYELAFSEIEKYNHTDKSLPIVRSNDLITSYTTRLADDITFLKHLGYRDLDNIIEMSESVENDVAKRLITLGFPHESLVYLSGESEGAHLNTRRLLRTKAALSIAELGKPIDDAAKIETPIVGKLRNNDYLNHNNILTSLDQHPKVEDIDGASGKNSLDKQEENSILTVISDPGKISETSGGNIDLNLDGPSIKMAKNLIKESRSVRDSIKSALTASEYVNDLSDGNTDF